MKNYNDTDETRNYVKLTTLSEKLKKVKLIRLIWTRYIINLTTKKKKKRF